MEFAQGGTDKRELKKNLLTYKLTICAFLLSQCLDHFKDKRVYGCPGFSWDRGNVPPSSWRGAAVWI